MTNEEKAKEIANEMVELAHYSSVMTPDEQRNNIMNVADVACMKMAKWKDEQFNKILDETYEMRKEICRSNVSFADCTVLIQQIRKKLEG